MRIILVLFSRPTAPSPSLLLPTQQQRLGELQLHVRAQRRGFLAPFERKLRGAHDVLLRAWYRISRSHPAGATRAGLELDVALGVERLPDGVVEGDALRR